VESHILVSAVCSNFPKSSNLTNLPVINNDSDPNRNVGRTDLSGELGSVPAPRETDPTPVLTRPGVGPASTMVARSRAWKVDRDVNTVPEIEFRPETDIPAETCEGGLGTARPFAIDTADQYITADTPEVVIGQGVSNSQEASTSFLTTNTQTAPAHTFTIPPSHTRIEATEKFASNSINNDSSA